MTDLHDKARALLEGPKCYPSDTGRTVYTPVFMKHLAAMTQEGLHDKGNIAEQLAYRDQIIADLLAENERLAGFVSKLHARPVGPDRCPFTGREFWGNITHPELGEVATYGGPFDTYTLPARTDDDEEYFVRRFDHDRGHWLLDDMEFIGLKLVDDQLYTSEDDPAELRARAEAAEARYKALCEAEPDGYSVTEAAGFTECFYSYEEAYNHAQEAGGRPIRRLIHRPSMEGGK